MMVLFLAFTAHAIEPGDMAFTMLQADSPDAFAFVALAPIARGTEIRFTDDGWQVETGTFAAVEGRLALTLTDGLAVGDEVIIDSAAATVTPAVGTLNTLSGNVGISTSADQIFAYYDDEGIEVPIAGITSDVYTDRTSSTTTGLPPGAGRYVAMDSAVDNGYYKCLTVTGHVDQVWTDGLSDAVQFTRRNTTAPYSTCAWDLDYCGDSVCDAIYEDDLSCAVDCLNCSGDVLSGDRDADGVCDDIDPCPVDALDDSDDDGSCDGVDICTGDDATGDDDFDGICDDSDLCSGDNATGDSDSDGVCDDTDACPVDAADDSDSDGSCDSADLCTGDDTLGDTDSDGVCDDIDTCPVDFADDSDLDGSCDSADLCTGDDTFGDTDSDGVCDDIDICPEDAADDSDLDGSCDSADLCTGDDTSGDSDSDGVCDDTDVCPEDAADDSDSDGSCDSADVCTGDDTTGDTDTDGFCADLDCDDSAADVYPGAPELCDGLDNACVGEVPNEDTDMDGDGFSICDGDCADANIDVSPTAIEICDDGIDNDCVGGDEACPDTGDTADTASPTDTSSVGDESGCNCETGSAPSSAWLLLGALFWTRRSRLGRSL